MAAACVPGCMGRPRARRASEIPRRQEFDPMLAALIFASLVLHFGFVFYLHQLDWPRQAEEVPEQYWHLLPPPPPVFAQPRPAAATPAATTAVGRGKGTRHATGKRVTLIEALGGGGSADRLRAGEVDEGKLFDN